MILTEDKLLQKFVERAVQRLHKEDKKRIRVDASDLGVSEMLSNQLRAHIQSGAKTLMVIDGDQKAVADIFVQSPNDLSDSQKKIALQALGQLHVSIVGGSAGLDSWMEWCKKRVLLLDELCPEKIFLSLIEPGHALLNNIAATNNKFKSTLRDVLLARGDDVEPSQAASAFKHILGEVPAGSAVDKLIDAMKDKILSAIIQFDE